MILLRADHDELGDIGTRIARPWPSQRCAAAVVQERAGEHGVAAVRLKPAGTGPLAPIAPNETEAGRAYSAPVVD